MSYSRIAGTGGYLPVRSVSNQELAARVDSTDEWIQSRTGIESRHFAAEGELTSDLAAEAGRRALAAAKAGVGEVDLIVVATTTPDQTFPSTACIVQDKLGLGPSAAFDLQAVCAGFVYALSVADRMIAGGQHDCALVIGADVFSRLLDFQDRRTCVLFGDGAGAVVLRRSPTAGILASRLGADGRQRDILRLRGAIRDGRLHGHPYVEMDGPAVFRTAVRELEINARETLAQAGLQAGDLDWYIPHQANIRIIRALADKLDLPEQRVVTSLARQGNTSAASVPLALDGAIRDGRIGAGQLLMMQGVGGGMSWGTVIARL